MISLTSQQISERFVKEKQKLGKQYLSRPTDFDSQKIQWTDQNSGRWELFFGYSWLSEGETIVQNDKFEFVI